MGYDPADTFRENIVKGRVRMAHNKAMWTIEDSLRVNLFIEETQIDGWQGHQAPLGGQA